MRRYRLKNRPVSSPEDISMDISKLCAELDGICLTSFADAIAQIPSTQQIE